MQPKINCTSGSMIYLMDQMRQYLQEYLMYVLLAHISINNIYIRPATLIPANSCHSYLSLKKQF